MERAPSFNLAENLNSNTDIIDNNQDLEKSDDSAYEILQSLEDRAKYLQLTDELIYKIVSQKIDVAIFLDKSARPVAWLVDKLWDKLAPDTGPDGQAVVKPEIKFLNIDREQWGAMLGRSEDKTGGINVDRLDNERAKELKELYAPIKGRSKPEDQSLLTGKNVLIVDEVRQSGDTLSMAEGIIKKVFPDANSIKGTYWMFGYSTRDPRSGAKVGTEVPVWYSDREVTGRLVANRDTFKSSQSNSDRQRIGRYWLSTGFKGQRDEKGLQLKQDVKRLAKDLKEHRLIYIPSPLWSESFDPIEDRIARLNDISMDDYVKLRQNCKTIEELANAFADYMSDTKQAG